MIYCAVEKGFDVKCREYHDESRVQLLPSTYQVTTDCSLVTDKVPGHQATYGNEPCCTMDLEANIYSLQHSLSRGMEGIVNRS